MVYEVDVAGAAIGAACVVFAGAATFTGFSAVNWSYMILPSADGLVEWRITQVETPLSMILVASSKDKRRAIVEWSPHLLKGVTETISLPLFFSVFATTSVVVACVKSKVIVATLSTKLALNSFATRAGGVRNCEGKFSRLEITAETAAETVNLLDIL